MRRIPTIIINGPHSIEDMAAVKPDKKRRITIPKELLRANERFVIIRTKQGILLKPLPQNPIEAFQQEGKKLKSTKSLKKLAERAALEEV